jgi:hypothetical protein
LTDVADIEARYSNYLDVGHSAFEFLLDFGQHYESDEGTGRIHTRIVTSPYYAKQFARLLEQALHGYEAVHGDIPNEET